jgi:acetyl esterase/lipase
MQLRPLLNPARWPFYVKLYKAYRGARKFRAEYEHLARDVVFHPEMDVRLDVYSPPAGANHPVIFFVHGGRWSELTKELFAPVATKLLPEGIVVVIPDHTLHPHARYEQMTHEVAAALSWTLENVERYGGDPERVVVAGHSSGAQLLGLAVMAPRFLSAYGHSQAEVCGMIGISGGYDLDAQYAFERAKGSDAPVMTAVMGGRENFTVASPINYVQPGLPPMLLIHGDEDPTIPVSTSIDFHAALQKAGVQSELKIYPGGRHSEMLFSALAEQRPQLVVDLSDFVHRCQRRYPTGAPDLEGS